MSGKYLRAIEPRHAYTGEKIPWRHDEFRESLCGRLYHYLSSGGLRAFGRSVAQEIQSRRRRRFFVFAACFFAAWLLLLVA